MPSENILRDQTECPRNKQYIVRLSAADRHHLTALPSKGKAAADKIRHAQSLLKADVEGPAGTDAKIATSFSVSVNTVLGVRPRVVAQGLVAARNRRGPPVLPAWRQQQKPGCSRFGAVRPPPGLPGGRVGYWPTRR